MKFLYILLSIISVQVFSFDETKEEFIQKDPERILFVGNSYLYYNDSLHNHFRRMVEEAFPSRIDSLEFKSATIGGSRLSHHNIDHLLNHKNLKKSEGTFQVKLFSTCSIR